MRRIINGKPEPSPDRAGILFCLRDEGRKDKGESRTRAPKKRTGEAICFSKIKKSSRRKTMFYEKSNFKNGKRPTSHRSTTYLCYVPILEESAGAGRVGLAVANIQSFCIFASGINEIAARITKSIH